MYDFYGRSEQGPYRNRNEDYFLINSIVSNERYKHKIRYFRNKNREEFILGIADGVGGKDGGDFASNFILNELSTIKETDYIPFISDQIKNIHYKLRNESLKRNILGASSTLTLLTALNEYITLYHIGDTRAYKLTPTKLVQLTTDQTELQRTIDNLPFYNPVKNFLPYKNKLLDAMGANEQPPKISIIKTTIEPDDVLLLTSDGIHDYLSNQRIHQILRRYKTDYTIVKNLINEAIKNGSKDNLTAVYVKYSQNKKLNIGPLPSH